MKKPESQTPVEYDAFISYSTDPDYSLVRETQRFIESFHKLPTPAHIQLKELRICVDGSQLKRQPVDATTNADDGIGDEVRNLISRSKTLVVFCSRAAADSDSWTNREIEWFLNERPANRVFAVVTEGNSPSEQVEEVFPPALLLAEAHKHAWYDFRQSRGARSSSWNKVRVLEDERIRLAVDLNDDADLAAGDVQPLWWREQQRQQKRRFRAILSFVLLVVTLLGYATYAQLDKSQVRAASLVKSLLESQPSVLPGIVEAIEHEPFWVRRQLRSLAFDEADTFSQRRMALGVLATTGSFDDSVWSSFLYTTPEEFLACLDVINSHQTTLSTDEANHVLDTMWDAITDSARTPDIRIRAAGLVAATSPESPRWNSVSGDLTQLLTEVSAAEVGVWSKVFLPLSQQLTSRLSDVHNDPEVRPLSRLAATSYLAVFAKNQPDTIAELVMHSDADQFRVLYPILERLTKTHPSMIKTLYESVVQQPGKDASEDKRIQLGRLRSVTSFALMRIGQQEKAVECLRVSSDRESHSQFIRQFYNYGITLDDILQLLDLSDNVLHRSSAEDDTFRNNCRMAALLALGEFPAPNIPPASKEALVSRVSDYFTKDQSSGVHGVAGWLLRKWNLDDEVRELEHREFEYTGSPEQEWFIRKIGDMYITFIVFRPGRFLMGSPESERNRNPDEGLRSVEIAQPFAMADRPVTRGEFGAFLDYYAEVTKRTGPGLREGFVRATQHHSPSDAHPALSVHWDKAADYCMWCSQVGGIPPGQQAYDVDYELIPGRLGYRLPLEKEWEYACRSGTVTTYGFGSDRTLLPDYGWNLGDSDKHSVVSCTRTRPNHRGLFDVHGNVMNWCQDVLERRTLSQERRVLRGGSYINQFSFYARSANRSASLITDNMTQNGMRIVCTLPE